MYTLIKVKDDVEKQTFTLKAHPKNPQSTGTIVQTA
jgi:hypothetical protein